MPSVRTAFDGNTFLEPSRNVWGSQTWLVQPNHEGYRIRWTHGYGWCTWTRNGGSYRISHIARSAWHPLRVTHRSHPPNASSIRWCCPLWRGKGFPPSYYVRKRWRKGWDSNCRISSRIPVLADNHPRQGRRSWGSPWIHHLRYGKSTCLQKKLHIFGNTTGEGVKRKKIVTWHNPNWHRRGSPSGRR